MPDGGVFRELALLREVAYAGIKLSTAVECGYPSQAKYNAEFREAKERWLSFAEQEPEVYPGVEALAAEVGIWWGRRHAREDESGRAWSRRYVRAVLRATVARLRHVRSRA